MAQASQGIPVRLSTFTPSPVSVEYAVESSAGPLSSGALQFVPGETVKKIVLQIPGLETHQGVKVRLENPVNAELTGIQAVDLIPSADHAIVPAGSIWKYWDAGTSRGTAWRDLDYDDGAWKSGPAELGFGDDDEATKVNIGPEGARFPAIYFRHRFEVADPAIYDSLQLRLRRDDGAVVYLNGDEVFRTNMPAGAIIFTTPAQSSSTSETTFFTTTLEATLLDAGANILAVEVHQANATSGDLSFDLELLGHFGSTGPGPIRFVRGDANGDGGVDIADAVKILLALFAGSAADCRDALDADDSGGAEITDAVHLLEYLFLKGPAPAAPFPAAGEDATEDGLDCKRTGSG
jgi:hypothetical protein